MQIMAFFYVSSWLVFINGVYEVRGQGPWTLFHKDSKLIMASEALLSIALKWSLRRNYFFEHRTCGLTVQCVTS